AEIAGTPRDLLIVEGELAGPQGLAELRARSDAAVLVLGRGAGEHDPSDPKAVVEAACALLDRRTAPPTVPEIFRR
ncbi:hypothetical protein ABTF16_24675, partial [Acinetobacter baumannii]